MEQVFVELVSRLAKGKDADAEEKLMEMRKVPEFLGVMQRILTSHPNSVVQFQAAIGMREVALARWSVLTESERLELSRSLLQILANRGPTMNLSVTRILVQAIALVWKRGWLQKNSALAGLKAELFEQVNAMLQMDGVPPGSLNMSVRVLGIRVLDALVDEFSLSRSSAMGVSLSFHATCHENFEADALKTVFGLGYRMLLSLIQDEANLVQLLKETPQINFLKDCLSLLESCLNWDFTLTDAVATKNSKKSAKSMLKRFELENSIMKQSNIHVLLNVSQTIRPGPAWRELVESNKLTELLFRFVMVIRRSIVEGCGNGVDDLLHQTRQLLIALAAMDEDVFENEEKRAMYMAQFLHGCLFAILDQPLLPIQAAAGLAQTFETSGFSAGSQEALCGIAGLEYLDMCSLLSRLLSNFGVETMLLIPNLPFDTILEKLFSLSCQLLDGGTVCAQASDSDVDNSWLMEAFGNLLETWSFLVSWAFNAQNAPVLDKASELYVFYLEKRLNMARASLDHEYQADEEQFEDVSVLDEHLLLVSILGRSRPGKSMEALAHVFTIALDNLDKTVKSGYNEAVEQEYGKLSEELYWITLLSAYLLADPSTGERAMVPTSILRASQEFCYRSRMAANGDSISFEQDPVIKLSMCLFRAADLETGHLTHAWANNTVAMVSPLLSQKILESLERWANTYLLPEAGLYTKPSTSQSIQSGSTLSESLESYFGPGPNGMEGIEFMLKISGVYMNWTSEGEVTIAALGLLSAVVENSCSRPYLLGRNNFKPLCEAHVSALNDPGWAPLSGLSGSDHGSMRKRLELLTAQAGANLLEPKWANDVAREMELYLALCNAADGGPLASWCRELLADGLATSWTELAGIAITALSKLGLKSASSENVTMVISSVLRLVCVYTDDQLIVTPEKLLPQVLSGCQRVLQIYGEYNRIATKQGIQDKEEWARDIQRLLKILYNIANRDMLDFSEDSTDNGSNVNGSGNHVIPVEIVFHGVTMCFPLITKDLLTYPGLAEQLYALLTTLIETYSNRLIAMDPQLFQNIVSAIEFGISDPRSGVTLKSLEVLYSLAQFHAEEIVEGKPGIGQHLHLNNRQTTIFVELLRHVLQFLLFQTYDTSLLNPAANAILAIFVGDNTSFPTVMNDVLQQTSDPKIQNYITSAFKTLANGIQPNDLSRAQRVAFQAKLVRFVSEVRGCLRTI